MKQVLTKDALLGVVLLCAGCSQEQGAPVDYRGNVVYGKEAKYDLKGNELPKYSKEDPAVLDKKIADKYIAKDPEYSIAAEVPAVQVAAEGTAEKASPALKAEKTDEKEIEKTAVQLAEAGRGTASPNVESSHSLKDFFLSVKSGASELVGESEGVAAEKIEDDNGKKREEAPVAIAKIEKPAEVKPVELMTTTQTDAASQKEALSQEKEVVLTENQAGLIPPAIAEKTASASKLAERMPINRNILVYDATSAKQVPIVITKKSQPVQALAQVDAEAKAAKAEEERLIAEAAQKVNEASATPIKTQIKPAYTQVLANAVPVVEKQEPTEIAEVKKVGVAKNETLPPVPVKAVAKQVMIAPEIVNKPEIAKMLKKAKPVEVKPVVIAEAPQIQPKPQEEPVQLAAVVPKVTTVEATPLSNDVVKTRSGFMWPVQGKIVAGFGSAMEAGRSNDGVNIAASEGAPIAAAADGVVVYADSRMKDFGNMVIIQHSNGWLSAYAHAGQMNVHKGETVRAGQSIATVGATGDVSSPQLHFALRKDKLPVDPQKYLGKGA